MFKWLHKLVKETPTGDLLADAQLSVQKYEQEKIRKGEHYMAQMDQEILKVAASGRTYVTTYHIDELSEDWETFALLDKIKQKYEEKGFVVETVKPYKDHMDTWLRIHWGGDVYVARKNQIIERVDSE